MNRFVIVDGLPFLYAQGKAYKVRWDDKGFTVGAEVELASVPTMTYPELSIKAKCRVLDSIAEEVPAEDLVEETDDLVEDLAEDLAQEHIVDFNNMTLNELKEYAKANDIKLNGARTKEAILKAIAGE